MNIEKYINKSGTLKEKYDFYKKLGFSNHVCCVLSVVSYGDSMTAAVLSDLQPDTLFEKLFTMLSDAEMEPTEYIYSVYEKKMREERANTRHSKAEGIISSIFKKTGPKLGSNAVLRQSGAGKSFCLAKLASEPEVFADGAISLDAVKALPDGINEDIENLATDSYEIIEEKDARSVRFSPTSTFRMTTNTASAGILLNQMKNGRRIDISQVRIEELLNYFDYKTKIPTETDFAISSELLKKKNGKQILYLNVQAKKEIKAHQNITILLDVSGSMCTNNEVTQEAIAVIVSKLNIGDIINFATYSSGDETVLDGMKIKSETDKETVMAYLLQQAITGCTYGSAGIETAYKISKKYYNSEWNNQVVLITDGDLNFGITEKGGLKDLIEGKKKENIFLSVIGTGLYNYKDDKLETLCKHGNGTYCVINSIMDVKESLCKRYAALTNIIAKDVKAQVEFNPKYVRSYRLLGYENRELNHEDFKNDKVISEPYGSGGYGIALFEITPEDGSPQEELKYQKNELKNTETDELCTVKVRYKEPLGDKSFEIEQAVSVNKKDGDNVRLAYLIYCISEELRKSNKLDQDDKKFEAEMLNNRWKMFVESNGKKLKIFIGFAKENIS